MGTDPVSGTNTTPTPTQTYSNLNLNNYMQGADWPIQIAWNVLGGGYGPGYDNYGFSSEFLTPGLPSLYPGFNTPPSKSGNASGVTGASTGGAVSVESITELMKTYDQDGDPASFTAEELRAAARAVDTDNPTLGKILLRLADVTQTYGKPITGEDLTKLGGEDGKFKLDQVLDLPEILNWGEIPKENKTLNDSPKGLAEKGGYNYLEIVELMKEFDNGDGVYTAEELRRAADKNSGNLNGGTGILARLADMAEAYDRDITIADLETTARRSGDDNYFTSEDLSRMPMDLSAGLEEEAQWKRVADEENDKEYADYLVVLDVLDRYDDGNLHYSAQEIEKAIEAIENGNVTVPNKDKYIDVLEKLRDLAEDHADNGGLPFQSIIRLAHKKGGDRWIKADDVNKDNIQVGNA